MKAIHNGDKIPPVCCIVVINHKTIKYESNSQPCAKAENVPQCCYQSQNYKIWKQFTTAYAAISKVKVLLSITKLQNLKAIHNINV